MSQFRVLYRQFLFRIVDLELLSADAQGDANKLLGQFGALLIYFSALLGLAVLKLDPRMTAAIWNMEHFLISTTMLAVGLFAVLSWDSIFPDRLDVLVLAPLPIRGRTLFLAKIASSGAALGVTVGALNAITGIALSFARAQSLDFYRFLVVYWITMIVAGGFIFCSLLCLQGIAAQLLPRRQFLTVSTFLQMAVFCLIVSVYFLQPSLAIGNQQLLRWLPSYWFLGLFEELSGSSHPVFAPLARRALAGLAISTLGAFTVFVLAYFRTLRKIVDEPDIAPGFRAGNWLPRFGTGVQTAGRVLDAARVAGELVFCITPVHGGRELSAANRRSLVALAVAPVSVISAAVFFSICPWRPVVGHVIVLGLFGIILTDVCLARFQKIPFACSYLPGKIPIPIAFLAAMFLMMVIDSPVRAEHRALNDAALYARMLGILVGVSISARWWATASDSALQFEDAAQPVIFALDLRQERAMLRHD